MKVLKFLLPFAFVALGGCSVLGDLSHGNIPGAVASVGDVFITPAIHAPIAHTALAAEGLYSGTVEILTANLKNRVITKAQGDVLDPYLEDVYNAVVALRPIQKGGGDATALLDAFNKAFGKLFDKAKGVGVTLPTSIDPAVNTKGTTP